MSSITYHLNRSKKKPHTSIIEESPASPLSLARAGDSGDDDFIPEYEDAPRTLRDGTPHREGRTGDGQKEPACTRDIFRLDEKSRSYETGIDIYPGVITLNTEGSIRGGRPSGKAGRKSKIMSFSRKSRNNLLKHFGMMETAPEVWQTFTFADDVMEGKTIEERKDFSSYCLNRFEKFLSARFPKIGMTWRREWERRKRGCLKGDWCPHFHVMYYKCNTPPNEYMRLVILFAEEWVRLTETVNPGALRVALHEKSYALLQSRTAAMKYVSKYMSKGSTLSEEGQSIGRSWGIIGEIRMAEPERIRLTDIESVMLLRFLRRYAKKKKSLVRNLKAGWVSTFVLISKSTIERFLRHIEDTISEEGRVLEKPGGLARGYVFSH